MVSSREAFYRQARPAEYLNYIYRRQFCKDNILNHHEPPQGASWINKGDEAVKRHKKSVTGPAALPDYPQGSGHGRGLESFKLLGGATIQHPGFPRQFL
jgi:hypothetical protein